ncbi:MAG: alpha/beta fold hydrolase [Hyphomicrobiales bacterium]|nr:alpha/beta fold hydrolase [Hyphomicrobiales bacterium]
MQQHSVTVNGQTIAYYESPGRGRNLLLIHGNSASARSYAQQVAGRLGHGHRIVAIDLPGHGSSSPAADPAATYTLPGYAAIIVALAEHLGLQDAIFVGWSLGGNILLEASNRLTAAAGIMILGTAPVGIPPALNEAFLPHPAIAFNFQADLRDEEIEAFARSLFRPGFDAVPPSCLDDIRRTDGRARETLAASIQAGNYADEVDVVARLTTPLAVVFGAQEQLVNTQYPAGLTIPSLWRSQVQLIPDAGHAAHWEQHDAFNRLLEDFIRDTAA